MNELINVMYAFALHYWVRDGVMNKVSSEEKSAVTAAVGGKMWAAALNKEERNVVDIFVYGDDDHDVAEVVYSVNVETGIVDTTAPSHV